VTLEIEHFRGASVLVTGGLGFIGSHIAIRLARAGAHVSILDAEAPDSGANWFNVAAVSKDVNVTVGDIRDDALVRRCVLGQDYLFNCAAQVSHVASLRAPLEDLDVNYRAQVALLDACRELAPRIRIVHASTRQVYGRAQRLPVDETHPVVPPDPNAINKHAAELYHLLGVRLHGMRTTILRMTNTYGPHMRVKDARQTFIGTWLARAVAGERFEVWGGTQVRDLTYVDDLVDACLGVALEERTCGEVYNVGGAESIALHALADLVIEVAGSGSYTVTGHPANRRAIDIGDYVADDRKLRAATGWAPAVSLRDGLARTVAFLREHGAEYA
jgi:UDP-glucose 4-epimerase